MKFPPRLRSFAASLLAAALAASAVPARQARAQQPARPGAARAKPQARQPNRPEAEQRAKPESRQQQQQREKAEAQQRADAADAAGVTIDELFAADAYAIYGELRMVGQHFASDEFRQLLEPLKLTGIAQPDLVELYDFVAANAEQLAGARVAFGGMPTKAGLPDVVAAVEMPSAEEARKFAPRLREFLAKSSTFGGVETIDASATTDPGANGADAATDASMTAEGTGAGRRGGRRRGRARGAASGNGAAARRVAAAKETRPSFHIKQAGAVVALAAAPFTFKKLRGAAEAAPLSRDPGFAAARARLSTETIFLYFNTARMGAATRHRAEEMEREHRRMAEEQERRERDAERDAVAVEAKAANRGSDSKLAVTDVDPVTGTATVKGAIAVGVDGKTTAESEAEFKARMAEVEESVAAHKEQLERQSPEEQARRREAERRREFENQLGNLIFTGDPASGAWPESIGVGAAFEGDAVVVRAFLVADSEDKPPRPVPLIPLLHAGPQVATEAANVLPADTDILVSASLDLPQMYDYVASMFGLFDLAAAAEGDADKRGLFDSQIGAYEKQLKFKIRDDLISALGNEVAIAFPAGMFGVRRARVRQAGQAGEGEAAAELADVTTPVVVVSLRDKRAVQSMLPRALEAAGIPGVTTEQLLRKEGEAELFTYGQGGVAFIDNFLVVAFDPRALKRVVAAYNEGRTLGQSRHYRDPADWQPRQVIGHAYVSSAILKDVFGDAHRSIDEIDDPTLRDYLTRLDPEPGAITLAATRDAGGLTHEVHVPKNLLGLWTASSLVSQKLQDMRWNEARAVFMLSQIARIQEEFKQAKGRYATMEELEADESYRDGFSAMGEGKGYELKMSAMGDRFEATATPTGYPKLGRRSFYVDQTGQLRGGDLGGRPASASSDPVAN